MALSLAEYKQHYLQLPYIILMLATAVVAVVICLFIIRLAARTMSKKKAAGERQYFFLDETASLTERFYELIFSATTIMLFVGIYFLIDFFGIGNGEFWQRYRDFLLLFFILVSIIFNSLIDKLIIPLTNIRQGERSIMRLIGMLYMLIIFAYIKFVYNDNNYDFIILYFLTLVIGRFIYFDATIKDFKKIMSEARHGLPILVLVLFCSALMALVGFKSGYLLSSNGVVLSLFIAHVYLLIVIFVVHWIMRLNRSIEDRSRRETRDKRRKSKERI